MAIATTIQRSGQAIGQDSRHSHVGREVGEKYQYGSKIHQPPATEP